VVVDHIEASRATKGLAGEHTEIALFEVMDFCRAALCLEQHCKRTVLLWDDGADRVHYDADFEWGCSHLFLNFSA